MTQPFEPATGPPCAPPPTVLNLSLAGSEVGPILERALEGRETTIEEGTRLFEARGAELMPLIAAADHLRREAVGERVTYVVNRNIYLTNVCV